MVNEVRFGQAFYRLTQDPTRTEEVFKLSDIGLQMRPSKGVELAVARAMGDAGFRDLLERRYRAPQPDFEYLESLSEETLGKQYFLHMRRNNLSPDFFPDSRLKDEVEYLIHRGREVHDIWHVLADYDTTVSDELALQGFTLSQLDSPISGVILASGILHFTRFEPGRLGEVIELIDEGHVRGRDSGYLFGVPWEKHWEMKLEDARSWMRIPPRSARTPAEVRAGA
jgi:ubiquinone biosynthesis protein Coq4